MKLRRSARVASLKKSAQRDFYKEDTDEEVIIIEDQISIKEEDSDYIPENDDTINTKNENEENNLKSIFKYNFQI